VSVRCVGKRADAELVVALWERSTGTGRNVTCPDRQDSVNGGSDPAHAIEGSGCAVSGGH